jgi:putative MATE family efflux protein
MNDSIEPASIAITASPSGKARLFWSAVREALLGSEQDFTEGSVGRAIALLAIPMVLETLMESLFGVVNMFWVAGLGEDATAAVGLTEALLTLVFALALGLGMGTTALVARRIGEKRPEEAARSATQSILLGLIVSALIGMVGIACAPGLLRLMGASRSVVETGSGYPTIILGGNVVIVLLFLNNAIFRGAGDAAVAMRALWLANAVNLVLDPCFIFGLGPFPQLGVTGSAIATTIGRSSGVAYQLWMLTRGQTRVRVERAHWRPDLGLMLHLSRISFGAIVQCLIATASWVALMRIVAIFGSAALAGYTVALRIIVFTILPSWGMSNAAATLVGQNLGAGKPDRAERSVWLAAFFNMLFLAVVAVVFIAYAERFVGFFGVHSAALSYGVDCLRYISYGYVFYAYGMVIVQAFNGAGDTLTPTYINLGCYWFLQIPLAYTLARPAGLDAQGVFIAITVAESLLAVVGIMVFRRGQWKLKKV